MRKIWLTGVVIGLLGTLIMGLALSGLNPAWPDRNVNNEIRDFLSIINHHDESSANGNIPNAHEWLAVDYAFAASYMVLLVSMCATGLRVWNHKTTAFVRWFVLTGLILVPLFDVVENTALWSLLSGSRDEVTIQAALTGQTLKFLMPLPWGLCAMWTIPRFWREFRQSSQHTVANTSSIY